MTEAGLPLLSFMMLSLPVGAGLIWLVRDEKHARMIALLTAAIDLMFAVMILLRFDRTQTGFQMVEKHDWIPTLNIHYYVGIDGISVLFLPLTVLLFIGVLLATWRSIRVLPRLYYSLLLLLESAILGIFCSLNTMLFFMFWELTLIPTYFLISLWGVGANRRYAAVKYTLTMLAGGVPLLFGFILLAFNHAAVSNAALPTGLVFDYPALFATVLPVEMQTMVFFLLLAGFAVKTPLFPLHTWLPTVAMEGPVTIVALMTGLKLGVYGLIRFVVPLSPDAAREFHWVLAGLGTIGILYGALVAMSQTNLRSMLAYSSFSHVGLVVLGIASFNIQGFQGALFQLLNFSIVAGGIFLLTGWIHQRIGSTDIISLGGLARSMPLLSSFFLLFGLTSMGMPGTSGFPAELLLIIGTFKSYTGAGLVVLVGIVLEAGYFLNLYRSTFMGKIRHDVVADTLDLQGRELMVIGVFVILILVLGIYPDALLDMTRVASENWVNKVTMNPM
ncbi:MAG: NADH-quinone oxidoreductase subunit M [Gammaproteobacteria bacterium]|nr:NADH-quinone oxidoreductase subunit M [Gammaproteobacteria bacterium]